MNVPTPTFSANGGLTNADFVQLAGGGLNDAANSDVCSMAWFMDRLYLGTRRNALALVAAARSSRPSGVDPWPVAVPEDVYTLDNRAQLLRYDPRGRWELVYVSPMVRGVDGQVVPRDLAYGGMVVFQARTDERPILYVSPVSSDSRGLGVHFLRCDGANDVEVAAKPLLRDRETSSVRALAELRGRLFMTPSGNPPAGNGARPPAVHVTDDPLADRWQPASAPAFGDPANTAIHALCAFRDQLYAGTLNPAGGFQIWKTDARGEPPYDWVRLVDRGAGRGRANEAICSMCVFKDALYAGTATSTGGLDRAGGEPTAPELLRVYPDDSWELVVGEARPSLAGRRLPQSGFGPGFDNRFTGFFWTLAEHAGWLYLGTLDRLVFALWQDGRALPPVLTRDRVEAAVDEYGGCELWRTRDGVDWEAVTLDGFGNPFNYGISTMVSTPLGLFVGTANPFGPQIAVRSDSGWEYTENALGGAEVWLGS